MFLLPTSPLDLTGVASYEIFLRGTLDKIGAYPDFLHVGDYKTAVNQFTEKGVHAGAPRDVRVAQPRHVRAAGARHRRGAEEERAEVRALIDRARSRPRTRCAHGLVDDLAYEDQLDDRVPELRVGARARCAGSRGPTTSASVRARSGFSPRSRIAVLYAVGTIVSGRSGFDPVNGAVVGSDTMVEQIRRVRDDDSIKAIVLRVDSPGGSSVASDVIWRELMITRDRSRRGR